MKQLSLTIGGTPIQAPSGVPTGGIDTGGKIIQLAIGLFLIGGILLALIMVIYSGIQWIMSGGDKQAIQQARTRLTYSAIGLIIILAAFFIVNVVGGLFGIKFF